MRSKRVVALISVVASSFLLLVLLWVDAQASEFYKPEPPPNQKQSFSQATGPEAANVDNDHQVPKSLLPDGGSLNIGSTGAGANQSSWIDRPGNGLKLGAAILGGISVVSFIVGGVFMGLARDDADKAEHCGSGIESIGCGFAGMGDGIIGISMLGAGAVTGITAIGLAIGGEMKEKKAAEEAQKRIEMSPYFNPVIEKNPSAASGVTFEGAVAGLKGTF